MKVDRDSLWDAIHDYVRSCGGDPAKHVYGNIPRMDAVVAIEKALVGEQQNAPPMEPSTISEETWARQWTEYAQSSADFSACGSPLEVFYGKAKTASEALATARAKRGTNGAYVSYNYGEHVAATITPTGQEHLFNPPGVGE